MQSPRDPKATLERVELQPGLTAFRCPATGGCWIDGEVYWNWLRAQPGFPKPIPETAGEPVAVETDSGTPMISPRSGRLMRKYTVGSGVGFRIDFDATSRGFWLDKDEYEALESRNLHDELHLICSPAYQKKLIDLRADRSHARRIEQLIGAEACSKTEAFAEWLGAQESRSVVLAYLHECLDRGF